jgi:hypothetical protein
MKKLTLLFTTFALLGPNGAKNCMADYKDMANQVSTVANFWIGGSLNDTSSSTNNSLAEDNALTEAAGRVGSNKASEYYALKSSGSGGVLLTGAPAPSRYHLEFDYYNDNDWFGDLRYSYKDYLQLRLLPRRLTHNLDNLTLFDFAPTLATTGSTDVRDRGVEDYRLRIDIDEYRLRLKTPNYPLHVYTNGEVIRKKGVRQARFLGGDGQRGTTGIAPGQVRASMAREVDQETQTMIVGTNAHLGPLEFDVSHKERKFESDLPTPTFDYRYITATTNTVFTRDLHAIPELKATSNTLKVHTSHTGRIFASATYSELEKTNESSHAEAETSFGYGEISWLPVAYLSIGAKVRHQKNEASAPATISWIDRTNTSRTEVLRPAVESQTDTAIITARYSLIPKSNLNLQYTRQVKDVEGKSAVDWGRPQKTAKDVYELGFTNWAIPRLRATMKLAHISNGHDYGNASASYEPVSIDPEHTSQGTLGLTVLLSPRLSLFANGFVSKEESTDNRLVGGHVDGRAKVLNQQGMMSLNFALNEKFSISPSYSYMSWEQERDIVWETSTGSEVVDSGFTSKQEAQILALALSAKPTKRLNINAAVDFTITEGDYNPTSPIQLGTLSFLAASAAEFSRTDTKEWNVRLDSEYDLGRGWGLGLDLRYVDWEDTSTDNPSGGIYYGGLFKVSKKLFY